MNGKRSAANAEMKSGEGARWDVYPALPPDVRSILDVGCGAGAGFADLRRDGVRVIGIDIDAPAVARAAQRLDEALVLDLSREPYPEHWRGTFDAVVFADVLEHLVDPWGMLATVRPLLSPGGRVAASIPNVRQVRILAKLALGRLEYESGPGTLQREHVRFFTRRTIDSMFREAGYCRPQYYWMPESWHLGRKPERLLDHLSAGRLADFVYGSYTVSTQPRYDSGMTPIGPP